MIGWHSSLFHPDNVVWSFLLKLYRLTLAGLLWFILNTLPMLFFIAVGLGILVLFTALHLFALMSINRMATVRTGEELWSLQLEVR